MTERPTRRSAVLAIFFASGISALLYQIVWLKYLGLIFGNTVHAAATLIAIFLAGLGLGGFLFTRWFRTRRPLHVYVGIEAVIALLGAFSPNAFGLIDGLYVTFYRSFLDAPMALAMARAGVAAVVLLPPTILMGGTLPVLVRAFAGDGRTGGRATSSLYAANTFGATAGVALAGFVLIPAVGLLATILTAVLINFLLAATTALLASRRTDGPAVEPVERAPASVHDGRGGGGGLLLAAALLTGLASIACEVFWTRVLVLHLGSSVYAYSLMLFCFLIGLAIGSAVIHSRIATVDPWAALALLQILLAVVISLQIHWFARFADVLEFFASLASGVTPLTTLGVFLGSVLTAILPPTLLMGATFPLIVRLYAEREERAESSSAGIVYLFNTIGSITGSVLAGFLLVRTIGSQNGLLLMGGVNLVLGWLFIMRRSGQEPVAPARRWRIGAAAASTALVLVSGALARPDQILLEAGLFADSDAKIEFFDEDVSATVTLRSMGDVRSLELNGVNVAGTSPDLIGTQKLQGHIPLLLHPDPKRVLHIGFGSGGTAWAVSTHPEVEHIRIVELSPEVLEASSRFFSDVNHGVLTDPRVEVEINDGRNFVLATPEKFDVLLSDSIHPRYAGNGSLYTRDYFRLCHAILEDDGVISMWLPMYSLTPENYFMILRAFRDVFPNSTLWYVPNALNSFTIAIGSKSGNPIDVDRLESRMRGQVAAELADIGIESVGDLASALLLTPEALAGITERVEAHIDDRPAVEYESGRLLDREVSWYRNFEILSRFRAPIAPAFEGADRSSLAEAEERRNARYDEHLRALRQHIASRDGGE